MSINVASNIWHILDVPANSPADIAGLLPYSDYIIGSPDGVLLGENGLGELVESYIRRPLRLYIYNNEFDVTREITINPSRDWGGEGALGCVLGFGALHRLPAPLNEPIDEPGQTLFETENFNLSDNKAFQQNDTTTQFLGVSNPNDLLIPAQLTSPQVKKIPTKKREKRHETGAISSFMNDYFLEGEKKSREIDNAPSAKTSMPPPPRASKPVNTESDVIPKE